MVFRRSSGHRTRTTFDVYTSLTQTHHLQVRIFHVEIHFPEGFGRVQRTKVLAVDIQRHGGTRLSLVHGQH